MATLTKLEYEEDYWDDVEPLVFDNGTDFTKAGFAADDAPRAVFPTIAGRLNPHRVFPPMAVKDKYIGDEAIAKKGVLILKRPMEKGIIMDFDDMVC